MADAKLTALTAASALAAADLFYVSQSAASRKATGTQLLALVGTTYVPLAGGTMTGALTIASGTLTASAPALNITQTWNNGSVGFTAALIDITNSASTGSSYPLLIKLGGSNLFAFSKAGELVCNSVAANIDLAAFADTYIRRISAGVAGQYNGASVQAYQIYSLRTDSSNYERLTLTGVAGTSVNITAETLGTGGDNIDIVLTPAGTGATLHPVGTFSKPGIGFIGFTGTGMYTTLSGANVVLTGSGLPVLNVAATYCGFPTAAVVGWSSSGSAGANPSDVAFARNAAGIVEVCSGTAGTYRDLKARNLLNVEYHEMTEMTAPSAPAANSVRIYAVDNGAGKTQLMALFASGAAQQIAIEP